MDQKTKDVLNDIKLSMHELEARVMNLEKDSHPPVFEIDSYELLDARLQVIEAFYNNIKLITTNKEELE
tara:strand:- start:263 stop:469 length:207 start_codon:yes stop_codon:yes gene_type:complete